MYRWGLVSSLAGVAVFLGCGNSGDKLPTVKAGGTVTLNGEPVEGANVYFSPKPSGRAAYGLTDRRGRFQVNTTPAISGVMPGSYHVGISKQRMEGGASTPDPTPPDPKREPGKPPAANMPKVVNELPERYKDPAKSGLAAEVKAGETNDFQFDLKKE